MKKIYILIAFTGLFILSGCEKFLDLKPENIEVVSSVEDYRDLLASYMRLLKTPNPSQQPVLGSIYLYPPFDVSGYFPFRSGELTASKSYSFYYDANLGEFTKAGVEAMTWMGTADGLWNKYYSFLGPINMIIGGIADANGDDERLRDYVKGEALVWRAYSYFKLLQYYAPYDRDEWGIPVYLKPYEDVGNAMPRRETQTDVYKRILTDCGEVLMLMDRTPSTHWNCAYHPYFIHAMMASIYAYKAGSAAAEKDDWQLALEHADKAMTGRTFAYNPKTYADMFDAPALKVFASDEFYLRMVDGFSSQIARMEAYYQISSWLSSAEANPGPEPEFYALYKEDDVRKKTFFRVKSDQSIVFDKYNFSSDDWVSFSGVHGGVVMLFRAAEVQLNKAEALCRLERTAEAREALDAFKRGRYLDVEGSYTESDLLREILKERKLEFYHEGDMWWLDMKRTGTRVERIINGTTYVLEPDDFRYSFPIPASEIKVNKNMVQTPGWDKINL